MDILEQIMANKRREVEQRKKEFDVSALESERFFSRETYSLKQFIADPTKNRDYC